MQLNDDLRYNGYMDANNIPGIEIGYISACIAGDYRYTSQVRVYLDGDNVHVFLLENGAVGGMDGPGGSTPFRVVNQRTVKATAKDVVNAIKSVMDSTIKSYGKPTKKFTWVGIGQKGLSQACVVKAIAFAKEDGDAE